METAPTTTAPAPIRLCGGYSPHAKFIRSFGPEPSIDRFVIRGKIGVKAVNEYDFDVRTQTFKPRVGTVAPLRKVKSAYNGFVDLPLTDDMLISNVYFGGKRVQIAVYDARDETEQVFMAKHFSSNIAVNSFFVRVNSGYFAPARAIDPYSVNAFFSILSYYMMLFTVFGRVGLPGKEHAIVSIANVRFTNAFWTGFCMVFGNAKDSGGQVKPLTSVDVCGHELSHGLQTFSTEFEYQGESGALNESIADVFGTFLEFYINSPVDTPDWTLGEQFQYVIRDFKDPKSHEQPTFYGGPFWINPRSSEDNGGVHTNSGVTNFMCYLAIEGSPNGGSFVNDAGVNFGKITPVPGFDLKTYTKILYTLLFSKVLPTNAGLKDFAREFCKIAQAKYPAASTHLATCSKAVGLLTSSSPTIGTEYGGYESGGDYGDVYGDGSGYDEEGDVYNHTPHTPDYENGEGGEPSDPTYPSDPFPTPPPPSEGSDMPPVPPVPPPSPVPPPPPPPPRTVPVPPPPPPPSSSSSPSNHQKKQIQFKRRSLGLLKGYTNVGIVREEGSSLAVEKIRLVFDPSLLFMANMYSKCVVSFWFNISQNDDETSLLSKHSDYEREIEISSEDLKASEIEIPFSFSAPVSSFGVSVTSVFAPWLSPKGFYEV